jgi:hypothetical protein
MPCLLLHSQYILSYHLVKVKAEMLRIPHRLQNRPTDGGKVVSPIITILDIFHRPREKEEREREREKKVGGVVRDTTILEGGVIET